MKGKYGVNRLDAFKYEAKQFLDGNKKYILIMVAVFVLALVIGIVIGSTSGIKRFNEDELIFGSWRFFARTLLMLLPVYVFVVFSAVNFLFIVLSYAMLAVWGIFFGRAMCILVACLGFSGVLNLVLIYLPICFFSLIFVMISLAYSVSQFPVTGCKAWQQLKPVLATVGIMAAINLVLNLIIIFICGLIIDVIVV
ncbi:unknown [Acidaminococcus sp. CAG:917]|nr:unknown [Acidaminococcus sp. CAG:917]